MTVENEGLYPQEGISETGQLIPRYYFAFDEYDPETRFVADLPSIRGGDPYPEITEEQLKEQKTIYHQYFYIGSIKNNLEINKFLSKEQIDRFEVHYSFLSMFVHPTKAGTICISDTSYIYPYTPKVMQIARHELILLYIAKLESLLLKSLIEYFIKINPKTNMLIYLDQIEKLENASKDFWFTYNDPTKFDIKRSITIKEFVRSLGYKIDDETILYYRNPLTRQADLLITQGKVTPEM